METQDLIAIVPIALIMMMLGFVIGMYITTQISDWIDKRRKNGKNRKIRKTSRLLMVSC